MQQLSHIVTPYLLPVTKYWLPQWVETVFHEISDCEILNSPLAQQVLRSTVFLKEKETLN